MDDLDLLGVIPSDRKKLESMGITKLEQLALLTHDKLGMGRGKGKMLIRRSRNIIANRSIINIDVGDNEVKIKVKEITQPIMKSVFSSLGVYDNRGSASLTKGENEFILHRTGRRFDQIVENANIQRMILEGKEIIEGKIDDEEIIDFAKKRRFDGFWKNVFKEIKGNEIMKEAIAVSMFSTYEEPVHSLIIGEPGSAKTLAKEVMERNFDGITSIGSNTTRAGLVCNLGTGDLGALAYSNGKLILVDEFDKIPEGDVEYCYELLSNGRCSVHSAKLHRDITSKFVMIAFANPSSQIFSERPLADIPLPPLLMSRFALIIKTENIGKEERLELFKEKFYGKSEIIERKSYYDRWVHLAREHRPKIEASTKRVNEYLLTMNEIVEEHYSTELRRDLRMGDYIRRIPLSIARASFGEVTDEILNKAEEILEESIESWS